MISERVIATGIIPIIFFSIFFMAYFAIVSLDVIAIVYLLKEKRVTK